MPIGCVYLPRDDALYCRNAFSRMREASRTACFQSSKDELSFHLEIKIQRIRSLSEDRTLLVSSAMAGD